MCTFTTTFCYRLNYLKAGSFNITRSSLKNKEMVYKYAQFYIISWNDIQDKGLSLTTDQHKGQVDT